MADLGFDGKVFKEYHGPDAPTRFANEVRVLQYLQSKGCRFVPQLLDADPERAYNAMRDHTARLSIVVLGRLKKQQHANRASA